MQRLITTGVLLVVAILGASCTRAEKTPRTSVRVGDELCVQTSKSFHLGVPCRVYPGRVLEVTQVDDFGWSVDLDYHPNNNPAQDECLAEELVSTPEELFEFARTCK